MGFQIENKVKNLGRSLNKLIQKMKPSKIPWLQITLGTSRWPTH